MIITIDNKLYDITEFIKEHPGGSQVFKNGADMTEDFNQVGHSKEAIKMLEKYLVKTDKHNQPIIDSETEEKEKEEKEKEEEINLDNISIYEFLFYKFNNSKISKLFTHEDYLNMHKIFGFITLCNFAYSPENGDNRSNSFNLFIITLILSIVVFDNKNLNRNGILSLLLLFNSFSKFIILS